MSPANSRRRRAPAACSFCRRRKIKCNGQRPVCLNCATYGEECFFEPVSEPAKEAGRARHVREKSQSQRPRQKPAARNLAERQATAHVEEQDGEGSQARASIEAAESSQGEAGDDAGSVEGAAMGAQPSPDPRVSRIITSANGISSYHGRTSALFEDSIPERQPAGDVQPRMPDDWIERGLVAEAARQNQMEQLNYRNGKLDFDGIPPDLGMHLLSLHWNRQHHSFLVTYRPAFMRDMACSGPYFSKLLLNAIYFGAAKFSPRLEVRKDPGDVRTAGWQFRQRVRTLLGEALDRSDMTTIQALLVMTNSLFALGDERSAAWLYSGLAFRMITDLGVHVDLSNSRRFTDEDLEIRRRVFWGAFVVDKIQSLYQGRPVSLKESDALVPIRFLDVFEELEPWTPFAYSESRSDFEVTPAYSTSTFASLCRLSLVMSDILSTIYTERSSDQSPSKLAGERIRLHEKLRDWEESLPSHLEIDATKLCQRQFPPPHVFSLHAMHHVLVILLHRPFVADGHLYSTSRQISVDSFMKCASAASAIVQLLRAYHAAFSIRRAPYLISYATYVAATIHARIAARRSRGSTAHAKLATCLAVFRENQETNSAVRKANVIVESLMKRLGVVVAQRDSAGALRMDQDLRGNGEAGPRRRQSLSVSKPVQPPSPLASNRSTSGGPSRVADLQDRGITAGVAASSPASDMMDVDSIIQSFLQEGEAAGGRGGLPVTAQAYPQQQPLQQLFPQNSPASASQGHLYSASTLPGQVPMAFGVVGHTTGQGPAGAEAVPAMVAPWQQQSSRDSNLSVQGVTPSALERILRMGATTKPRMHTLPCVLMRAGTSKGLFIHRNDLPTQEKDWIPLLISALGSRGCDPRQIDGIGGGTSTTSKVAVVSPSTRPGIDVDFTFVQVAVGRESADFSGNCGNMVSGVGPFAVQEGLVRPAKGASVCQVKIYNTNTKRVIVETVEIDQDGQFREDGEYNIPGVSTSGSEIKVAFLDPAGSMTGRLFPTGQRQQVLAVQARRHHDDFKAKVTLIDAANPFVLIDATSISPLMQTCSPEEQDDLVESIRITGAVQMGLARDTETASKTRGTPKAILLYPPVFSRKGVDIRVLSYSMGKPHPSLQLTGAVGVAAALRSAGTVAEQLSRTPVLAGGAPLTPERTPSPADIDDNGTLQKKTSSQVLIEHAEGAVWVEISMETDDNGEERVGSCAVSRTARRLFEGKVRYYV
ncbi:hypothetical protein MY10362_008646 [Beauveria mimosiformis]